MCCPSCTERGWQAAPQARCAGGSAGESCTSPTAALPHSSQPAPSGASLTHLQVSSSRTMARTMVPSITSVRLQMSLNGMPRAHSYTTCSPQGNRRRQGCTAMRGVNGCQASVPAVQLANAGGQRLAPHPVPLQAGGPQTVSNKACLGQPKLEGAGHKLVRRDGQPALLLHRARLQAGPTGQVVAFESCANWALAACHICMRKGREAPGGPHTRTADNRADLSGPGSCLQGQRDGVVASGLQPRGQLRLVVALLLWGQARASNTPV